MSALMARDHEAGRLKRWVDLLLAAAAACSPGRARLPMTLCTSEIQRMIVGRAVTGLDVR
jgi:hypothetical protein